MIICGSDITDTLPLITIVSSSWYLFLSVLKDVICGNIMGDFSTLGVTSVTLINTFSISKNVSDFSFPYSAVIVYVPDFS